jgi:hypothetical protein
MKITITAIWAAGSVAFAIVQAMPLVSQLAK